MCAAAHGWIIGLGPGPPRARAIGGGGASPASVRLRARGEPVAAAPSCCGAGSTADDGISIVHQVKGANKYTNGAVLIRLTPLGSRKREVAREWEFEWRGPMGTQSGHASRLGWGRAALRALRAVKCPVASRTDVHRQSPLLG